MPQDPNNRIHKYEKEYLKDYSFEAVMVRYRRRLILEIIGTLKPRTVLEIGCGNDLLFDHLAGLEKGLERWIIVEPAPAFSALAMERVGVDTRLVVIQDFVENAIDAIAERMPGKMDLCILSGVLHEVEHPVALLKSVSNLLSDETVLHANVPNAYSLHRRLAKAMGLIKDEHDLNQRNRALEQYRVYDAERFRHAFESAGYSIIESGGHMLKPFTHGQMAAMQSLLSENILEGLWRLGRQMPELAAEIYINARR